MKIYVNYGLFYYPQTEIIEFIGNDHELERII